jgi:hypothetical protein
VGQWCDGDGTMRVRALSATGDYTFGQGQANYLVNSPAAVAQLVVTSLLLLQGEWYLDVTQGMPWVPDVLGVGTTNIYDKIIQAYVLSVQGVTGITEYSSSLNTNRRSLTVTMTLDTLYGPTEQITLRQIGAKPFILGSSLLGGTDVLG